ncbi:uncharacterized protein E0L32_007830 [Thyridium curvatum]|uniref:glutathione-specific gamma-glutamylcyclotransferase n=1 Tax=Thyridium curvatum TaxID=1093900 RepID=A0A507B2W7_9PEZI|nr:uncharacterized protein E0L32_007830 [Thyridium curvatum]TPX11411.1 hypothetical protein E0L32_007830 [Thyridium curvatum]
MTAVTRTRTQSLASPSHLTLLSAHGPSTSISAKPPPTELSNVIFEAKHPLSRIVRRGCTRTQSQLRRSGVDLPCQVLTPYNHRIDGSLTLLRLASTESKIMSVDEHHLPPPTEDEEFWLFGYGYGLLLALHRQTSNLTLLPPFSSQEPHLEASTAFRAHWATLGDAHHAAPARVWGCAYRIARPRVAEVKAYLDIREINGYTIHYTPFHPASDDRRRGGGGGGGGDAPTTTIRTLVYIGTPDNAQFTGPQDVGALAEHIYRSEGPSGLNRDYLWGLERALDELSPESGDDHVSDLSERVRAIAKRAEAQKQGDGSSAPPAVIDGEAHPHHLHEFHRVTSVEESEETEKAD